MEIIRREYGIKFNGNVLMGDCSWRYELPKELSNWWNNKKKKIIKLQKKTGSVYTNHPIYTDDKTSITRPLS